MNNNTLDLIKLIKTGGVYKMNYSFEGYKRDDGMAGTRNYVGIVSSVLCSSAVVREISDKVTGTLPNVHANGCAQLGDDRNPPRNMPGGMTANPILHSAQH